MIQIAPSFLVQKSVHIISFLAVFLVVSTAHADGNPKLKRSIDEVLKSSSMEKVKASIHVVDLGSGETLYEKNPQTKLNPASNIKLITAGAVLDKYGPGHTFTTELYSAKSRGGVVDGDMVLVGGGDPFLLWSHLLEMAERARRKGITEVTGDLIVDDSVFDNVYLPPAFGQKSEDAAYRPSVSGAAAEFGALNIIITGGKRGKRPRVQFDPPNDYALVENKATTVSSKEEAKGGLRVAAVKDGNRSRIIIEGKTYPGGGASVRKRMQNPSLFTGYMMKRALKLLGVNVKGKVRIGKKPGSMRLVARHSSYTMTYLCMAMQKWSNNFMAEMLFKSLDIQKKESATWKGAQDKMRKVMQKAGIEGDFKLSNGSGLYDANALSARQFTQFLQYMQTRHDILPDYDATFAIGGVDGTLKRRMQARSTRLVARGKTGTLSGTSTLTGYIQHRSGRRIGYSILFNKTRGGAWAYRKLQDEIVEKIGDWKP